MEQELKNTLKTVQLQIRFPEEIDIESILNKKKRFRAKQAVIFVALMVLFLLLVPNVTPSWAGLKLFGTSDQPPHPYSEYLVHDAHYYIPTNERVSKEQLSSKLGTISRIAKQVEKPDVKSIFGGKNDPSEVQAAYQNIRREVRFLRILQSPELERTSIALRNDGSRYHVQLEYRPTPKSSMGQTVTIPGDDHTTEKFIWIQEYPEGYQDGNHPDYNGDFQYDPNHKIGEFVSNGVKWVQYSRNYWHDPYNPLFTTKVNRVIYEVSSQGCTVEELKKLVETLAKSPKK